jgi:hypothetical protein
VDDRIVSLSYTDPVLFNQEDALKASSSRCFAFLCGDLKKMSTGSHEMDPAVTNVGLNEQNAKDFWSSAWEHNVTDWRCAEQQPFFTRNLYVFARNAPGVPGGPAIAMPCVIGMSENEVNLYNGAAEEAVVTEFLRGKAVLVPLCGDTPAVRYMADHGASLVVGTDLAAEGLRRLREAHFGDVLFALTPLTLADGSTVIVYEGHTKGCTIRLFEGDFLALVTLPEFCSAKINFVYDRASMMAIHPNMREAYVETVAAALAPEAGLMVERPVRDEGDVSGPPFTFTADQVRSLYESATGRSYDVNTMLVNRWYGNPEAGSVHYFEFFRVYPKAA